MDDLETRAVELLRQLIRFDTVNPPGNERPAQELLARVLRDAGFAVELLGRREGRPNLIARLRGAADGPTLCLLSHVDTVYATAADWDRDPWSGDLRDGHVWGRGALDMKGQTAAEVAAAVGLARAGWRPRHGELLVVAVADEETGGDEGAIWLCEQHPEKVRCDFMLNEGGGAVLPFAGVPYYPVSTAEKGIFGFRLTTAGVAGHASRPGAAVNALLEMAPVLHAFAESAPADDLTEPARSFFGAGAPVDPLYGVTFAPTMISASEQSNVIPARAELHVDCRVPPGLGEAEARRRLHDVLGAADVRVDLVEAVPGNGSPAESPLMDAIRGWMGEQRPEARVVPTVAPAFTDSRTFRAAFPELVAYGFFPHRHATVHETEPLVHSANERIDVRDLGFAAACYAGVTRRLLG